MSEKIEEEVKIPDPDRDKCWFCGRTDEELGIFDISLVETFSFTDIPVCSVCEEVIGALGANLVSDALCSTANVEKFKRKQKEGSKE